MHSPRSLLFVQLLAGFVVLTPIVSWAADSPEAKNMERQAQLAPREGFYLNES
jgi:hypothetical protein